MAEGTEKELLNELTALTKDRPAWSRSFVLRCAETLCQMQRSFFLTGNADLAPATMSEIAKRLGIHVSTVSRALNDKYLQCARGVFPLHRFLSRGLSKNPAAASVDSARSLLAELIAREDRTHPLSDARLAELMRTRGIPLSRRTVAKYREALGISPSSGRKRDIY